jgi:hypothetical protein
VNTWKVILATVVIFVAGAVTGSLLVRQGMLSQPAKQARPNPNRTIPSAPGMMRVEFLRRAERELNLTPDQREQADKLIAASQERTRKIMEPVSPKIREELKQTKDEFRALLTADQQVRFDEMLKKQSHPREPHRIPAKAPSNSVSAIKVPE